MVIGVPTLAFSRRKEVDIRTVGKVLESIHRTYVSNVSATVLLLSDRQQHCGFLKNRNYIVFSYDLSIKEIVTSSSD